MTDHDLRSTLGGRCTDAQLDFYCRHPERYAAIADLVDISMTQRYRKCIEGECDDCGLCRRHDRFDADRALRLMARWGAAAARWTWHPLDDELPRWVLRQLKVGECVRVREFAGGSAHWTRFERNPMGGYHFTRCSDGEVIDAREVQVLA